MLQGIEHEIGFTGRKGKELRAQFFIIKVANTINDSFKNFTLYISKAVISKKLADAENQERAVSMLGTVVQALVEVLKKNNTNPVSFHYLELKSFTPIYTPMAQASVHPASSVPSASSVTPPVVDDYDYDNDLGGLSCKLF